MTNCTFKIKTNKEITQAFKNVIAIPKDYNSYTSAFLYYISDCSFLKKYKNLYTDVYVVDANTVLTFGSNPFGNIKAKSETMKVCEDLYKSNVKPSEIIDFLVNVSIPQAK